MILELQNITKTYENKVVLDNINCAFKNGVYGLLGPNGAGKSTMIRLICHLESPKSGKILLDGEPIGKLDARYRSLLGYVPQKAGYYPDFTAWEFLNYLGIMKGVSREEIKMRIYNSLAIVNLSDTGSKKIKNFSGGMKQRLCIAQAILNNPDILILDEPTVGLDLEERLQFKQFISEYADDRIVILATHIVSDVEDIGNEIVILSNGRIRMQSTPEELLSAIKGKVWDCVCSKEEFTVLKKKYRASTIKVKKNLVEIRVIADMKPTENAILAEGNLQDLYLSLVENG